MYQLIIPAQFAAGVAAGQIALMVTGAGATTTLVAGGQIVGVAALVEVGGTVTAGVVTGAGGAGAAGMGVAAASSVLLPIVVGVAAVAMVGTLLWWLFKDDQPEIIEAKTSIIDFEASPEVAQDVLRRAQAIVDAEYSRATEAPRVQLRKI